MAFPGTTSTRPSKVSINSLASSGVREEEDEVLQTRIVSNNEVIRDLEKWKPAIHKELNENLMGKAIHRPCTDDSRDGPRHSS